MGKVFLAYAPSTLATEVVAQGFARYTKSCPTEPGQAPTDAVLVRYAGAHGSTVRMCLVRASAGGPARRDRRSGR